MRVEPFTVGNYVHVYNRGHHKDKIVRSDKDKWRFMQALRFFNDKNSSLNILRHLKFVLGSESTKKQAESVFELGWPKDWPEKNPLVKILCYCLVPNHFHLLLKEIREGGISRFMHKLGTGYTNYSNLKYQEVGGVFQGSYKAKTITKNIHLEYLSAYIQVINVLELFPGGLEKALEDINGASKFVEEYPFSSYQDFIGLRKSLIIDKDILGEIFPTPKGYEEFVRDVIKGKEYEILGDLKIDEVG